MTISYIPAPIEKVVGPEPTIGSAQCARRTTPKKNLVLQLRFRADRAVITTKQPGTFMQTHAVQKLIISRYAAAHGAVPTFDFPHFCVVGSTPSAPAAALGIRLASQGPLFLEAYLDQPVDHILSDRFGRSIGRGHIVEIGAHASERSSATLALWAQTAQHLEGKAEFAVAVLTAPLRAMFDRLGIEIFELATADPARLPCGGKNWGRYYANSPMVCAGLIAPARQRLAAFADRFAGSCA